MENFLRLKKIIEADLDVSYKCLWIGKVKVNNVEYVQVDCIKYDLQFSRLYSLNLIDFAISKFNILLLRYMASELKNGN